MISSLKKKSITTTKFLYKNKNMTYLNMTYFHVLFGIVTEK